MNIIEKLSLVTRYGVAAFLAAASCFSVFADVPEPDIDIDLPTDCTKFWDGVAGGWHITCTHTIFGFIPAYDPEGSGGGCTNCVQMSPATCAAIKKVIEDETQVIDDRFHSSYTALQHAQQNLEMVTNRIYGITDEGHYFLKYSSASQIPGETASDKTSFLLSPENPTSPYFDSSTGANATLLRPANNGIYNYYNDRIAPDMEYLMHDSVNALQDVVQVQDELIDIYAANDAIRYIGTTMNCEACSSGSGGGDSGGGSDSPYGCPCSDLILKCVNLLSAMTNRLAKIEQFEKYLKTITEAVAPMGTNFNYAVQYKNLDGVSFQMKQLDKLLNQNQSQGFDFGEFGKFSWFSRVEYLLLSISGVYSRTNMTGVSSEALDKYYGDINDLKPTLQAGVDGVTSGFSSLATSYASLCNSLKSSVGTGSGNTSFNLFPSWFGGRGLLVTFPSEVISTARAVTSLFWSVLFACVLYEILLNGWLVFFDFFKFFVSSTSTMFS